MTDTITRSTRRLVADALALGLPLSPGNGGNGVTPAEEIAEVQDRVLEALPGVPASRRDELVELLARAEHLQVMDLRLEHDRALRDTAMLQRGLERLRACHTAEQLASVACRVAIDACNARRAEVLRQGDASSTPWELATNDTVSPSPDAGSAVSAPIRAGGRLAGILRVTPSARTMPDLQARVTALADAVSHRLDALDTLARLAQLTQAVEDLGAAMREHAREPLEPRAELPGFAGSSVQLPAIANEPDHAAPAAPPHLTQRQRETLELMARGLTNAQIADHLAVSVPTVKSHVRAILGAFHAVNRAEAISMYFARDRAS